MLVLSRQRDESIMIGNDVKVTVVDIRGDKVRLGMEAPPSMAIHRKEVYDAIRRDLGKAISLPMTANLRTQLDDTRNWLPSHQLPFMCAGTSIFSVEEFGNDYVIIHYQPSKDGSAVLVRESLYSCVSRNEAIAAMVHGVVNAVLQPDAAMNQALFTALKTIAEDCDARQESAGVPPVPARAS